MLYQEAYEGRQRENKLWITQTEHFKLEPSRSASHQESYRREEREKRLNGFGRRHYDLDLLIIDHHHHRHRQSFPANANRLYGPDLAHSPTDFFTIPESQNRRLTFFFYRMELVNRSIISGNFLSSLGAVWVESEL